MSLLHLHCSLSPTRYTAILSRPALVSWRACGDLRCAKNKCSHKIAMHLTYHIVKSKRKRSCFLWLIVDSALQGPDHYQILCPFFDTVNLHVPMAILIPQISPSSEA